MNFSGYRRGLFLFTLIGLVTVSVFIFAIDPKSLSVWGVLFFFGSLALFAAGALSLLLLSLYRRMIGRESASYFIGTVIRQGILLGLGTALLAFLQYIGLLAWWNGLLVLAFVLLLEFSSRLIFPTD